MIIFAGIVSRGPDAAKGQIANYQLGRFGSGVVGISHAGILVLFVAVIAAVIWVRRLREGYRYSIQSAL